MDWRESQAASHTFEGRVITPRKRGMGDFSALARAIFRQEGVLDASGNWVTSSLGYRYNNPGNLVYAGQPGAHPATAYDPGMGTNQTYAAFDTLANGVAATERQLALDASRGLTLAQRLATWATGNKAAYLANVTSWLGVNPDTPLTDLANYNAPPGSFLAAQTQSPASGPLQPGKNPAKA